MKAYLIFTTVFLGLVLNHSFAQTNKPGTQKTATTKSNISNKVTCIFCKGRGEGRFPVDCPNCINWSAEYRRKVPCHLCKDTRIIYQKRCPMCDGTGKLDKDWYKFGLSDKELDTAMKQASKYKKEMPAPGQVMTDDQAWKMFNEYANPELKENGYGEVRQTVMDDYPMRPKEDKTSNVEVFNKEDQVKFVTPAIEENDSTRREAFIQRELLKGDLTEEEIRKMVADQAGRNRSFSTGGMTGNKVQQEAEQKIKRTPQIQFDQKLSALKDFFVHGFTYSRDNDEGNDIKIFRASGEYFIIRDFEITGDILLSNSNPKAAYNKAGKLLYQGNDWSIKIFSYQDVDLNKTYICLYRRDDYTDSYKAIIGNSDDEVIIKMTDEVPPSAAYKKNELFAVFGTTEPVDIFSKDKIKLIDLFSTNSNDKFRYIALKVCDRNVIGLDNVNYQYQIFDLKSGKRIKLVSESSVNSYLSKLLFK